MSEMSEAERDYVYSQLREAAITLDEVLERPTATKGRFEFHAGHRRCSQLAPVNRHVVEADIDRAAGRAPGA